MKKLLALILASLFVFGLTACGKKDASKDKKEVTKRGKLVVGITDFEPMDYKEKGSDEWIGFDADLAKAFAKKLDVDIEFVEIDWDNKILELDNRSIDCVWNGMTLTDEVKKSMSYSKAYCTNAQVLVVPANKATTYKTFESAKDLKFAAESGSAGEKALKELGYKCTAVNSQADALMEVSAGSSDACVIDLIMAGAMTGEGTSYANLTYTEKLDTEEYVVGFRKGSDLVEKFNDFLKQYSDDGELMKLAEQYKLKDSVVIQ